MKFAILTAILLMAVDSIQAQRPIFDALKKELDKHPAPDTARVNRLVAFGRSRSQATTAELEAFSNEALAISQKIGYARGEAYATLNLGRVAMAKGDMGTVLQFLERADSMAKTLSDLELRALTALRMGLYYQGIDAKRSRSWHMKALEYADKLGDPRLISTVEFFIADAQTSLGNVAGAFDHAVRSLEKAQEAKCAPCEGDAYTVLANLFNLSGEYVKSNEYFEKSIKADSTRANNPTTFNVIGENHRLRGNYQEAIKAYNNALKIARDVYIIETAQSNLADVYVRLDSLDRAFEYAAISMAKCKEIEDVAGVAWIHGIYSRAYLKKKMPDSALYHAQLGLAAAKESESKEFVRDNYKALADAYAYKNDYKNAYSNFQQYIAERDSMANSEMLNKASIYEFNSKIEKKDGEIAVLSQQKQTQRNSLITVSVILLLILISAIALLRNNRLKQKAKNKIEKAYSALKATQAQLVQSEKMASLGELTAGIAHEIQNPLNFVNNFSEVNTELIRELKKEINSGNIDEANSIANDIESNSERISHHGKRADSIVKGMLQHSRTSSNKKELVDINALAEEYLRLSYHGLRAKDKSFNAEFKAELDPNVGKINVLPQEIGRVLLNLINNAFYAVSEKQKKLGSKYSPVVSVITKKTDRFIEINVKDNGDGIPPQVMEKIFQPFFTTKPTGQGTGLGLSLSFDIVTKSHGGDIKVDTVEGEGTTFTVQLPVDAAV